MQLDRRRLPVLSAALLSVLLFGCDHATKAAATASLAGRAPVSLVGDLVVLRYVENDDVAFSLIRDLGLGPSAASPVLLAVLACVGTAALAVFWWRARRARSSTRALRVLDLGFAAALAGALGNVVDRVTRGHVVDFIHVRRWPVFNVADILVVAGIAAIALAARLGGERAERAKPS